VINRIIITIIIMVALWNVGSFYYYLKPRREGKNWERETDDVSLFVRCGIALREKESLLD